MLLGALLVAAMTALILFSNLRYNRYIAASSLPSAATFFFVLTLLGNAVARRAAPRHALSVPELALIFAMLYVSAALPQASIAETLVTLGAAPAYYPKGSPRVDAFEGEIPSWLIVQDPEAVRRFYEGFGPSFAGVSQVPWGAWAAPIAGWSLFTVCVLAAMYCLSRIFAHRWVREERVSFPLMEMPLELMGATSGSDSPPVWRTALFWLGAAVPTAMISMGQFHKYYPWLPDWQQIASFPLGKAWVAQGPPLSALSEFTLSVWPLVIGVAYFLNGEVAVSIWGFHLLFWAQMYLYAVLGYAPEQAAIGGSGFQPLDWIHDMEFGAAVVLAGTLLWPVRREIARAARALVGRRDPGEQREPLTVPPGAVAGFVLANAGALAWAWAAGMSVAAAAAFLLFLYVLVIALGRMVAAGGLYLVDNGAEPQPLLYGLAGPGAFGRGTHYALTGQEALFGRADMSFFYFATNESKVADETGTARTRWHGVAILVAVGVALAFAYFLILYWSYRYGGVALRSYPYSSKVRGLFDRLDTFLTATRRGPDAWTYGGVAVGGLVAALLAWLNRTYLWWRVAPFGFAMASSWNVNYQIWSSVFIGWATASLVRRYGGLRLYRSLRPVFVGLIVGDAVTVTAMALLEIVVGA